MKKIILIVTFIHLVCIAKANILDSLVNLKGFYIIRYEKSDIVNWYDQEVKRLKGEAYSIIYDVEQIPFFIPVQLRNKQLVNLNGLIEKIQNHNSFNRDTIYYMPTSKRTEKYIEKTSKKKIDLSKAISLFQNSDRSYFAIKGSEKYIYKCVYIDGKALIYSVENTSYNRLRLDLDVDAVNMKSTKIHVVFLTELIEYDPYVSHKGLTPWHLYVEQKKK
jgi:hypothetical protein